MLTVLGAILATVSSELSRTSVALRLNGMIGTVSGKFLGIRSSRKDYRHYRRQSGRPGNLFGPADSQLGPGTPLDKSPLDGRGAQG